MNKTELVAAVAQKAELSKKDAEKAVAAGEYGKYADEEKKSFPSSGTEGKGA